MINNKVQKIVDAVSKGSTYISNNILFNPIIKGNIYKLYNLLLSGCFGNKSEIYYSLKTLSDLLECSMRSIQRYMKVLKDNNLIRTIRRGFGNSNVTIVLEKLNKANDARVTVAQPKQSTNKSKNWVNKNYSKKDTHDFNDYPQRDFDPAFEARYFGWNTPRLE